MSEKKTKVECHLIARGTEEANTNAIDDLAVPDPEPAVGKQIIKDLTKDDDEDDHGQNDS